MISQYLYHFSEDPNIERFEPRRGPEIEGRPPGELLVWAIDKQHSPVYYFPRECPRIVLWPIHGSTRKDIERWMGSDASVTPRMVASIESAWEERFRKCRLYRYRFDAAGLADIRDHGVHLSPNVVEPVDVEPVGDLKQALDSANGGLRVMESLQPLAEAWSCTLHFSGIRLHNAQDWKPPI